MQRAAAALLLLVACAAACSVNERSSAFACDDGQACPADRVCDRGYCVLRDGAGGDGGPDSDGSGPNIDADPGDNCPDACTTCTETVCNISCLGGGCEQLVVCPAGYICNVNCAGNSACAGGIDCSMATSCNLDCGRDTCAGPITCGTGPCDVTCDRNSCDAAIICDQSCSCLVDCGMNACALGATCPASCDDGDGCTNAGACDSCP